MKLKKYLFLLFAVYILSTGLTSCISNKFTYSKKHIEMSEDSLNVHNILSAVLTGFKFDNPDTCSEAEQQLYRCSRALGHNNIDECSEIAKTIKTDDKDIAFVAGRFAHITTNLYDSLKLTRPSFSLCNENEYPVTIKENRVYIKTIIDNKEYNFMIDNGCPRTEISDKIVSNHSPQKKEFTGSIKDATGKNSIYDFYLLNEINLANIKSSNVLVYGIKSKGYDGIIGFDILSQFDVRIDFKHKKILFKKSDPADLDTNYRYT